MDLSKKTTILFSPETHRRLSALAARRGVSLGELVREACDVTYGVVDYDARVAAARQLAAMQLPTGTPEDMKRESVVSADALLP